MTTSTLILLRHGESLWNRENRFTGWNDVPLTEKGRQEADRAGLLLREARLRPDCVSTSVLTRCVHTVWQVLVQLDRSWLPVDKTWRLNERHYGALQGLNKDEAARMMGEEKVRQWRKSFLGIPPADFMAPARLHQDPRYWQVALSDLPATESLEMTIRRVLPYWRRVVMPQLQHGKTVLIVGHGNSLRALIMYLNGMTEEDVMRLHVPTGVPVIYEMNTDAYAVSHHFLTPI
ncbi:2,3-diphosphoglycerate-dependent phosphoglycerate mutase [Dryocola sp. BD613]|uniref:2,3-diphosphoglycerate-dependent phosphoglycerate mutase n=1 Tax=Dryocola sp. BD613 TaxID=3133272 RepID=UPI003F4FFF97